MSLTLYNMVDFTYITALGQMFSYSSVCVWMWALGTTILVLWKVCRNTYVNIFTFHLFLVSGLWLRVKVICKGQCCQYVISVLRGNLLVLQLVWVCGFYMLFCLMNKTKFKPIVHHYFHIKIIINNNNQRICGKLYMRKGMRLRNIVHKRQVLLLAPAVILCSSL